MIPDRLLTLTVLSPSLTEVTHKAVATWEKALDGRVAIRIGERGTDRYHPDITVDFGKVDDTTYPGRIAQADHRTGRDGDGVTRTVWSLILGNKVKWQLTRWQRFWGIGDEDALAAVMHELGHALGFPHSGVETDVMHWQCGTSVISSYEAKLLRAFWDRNYN